jgi:hypothetical protein
MNCRKSKIEKPKSKLGTIFEFRVSCSLDPPIIQSPDLNYRLYLGVMPLSRFQIPSHRAKRDSSSVPPWQAFILASRHRAMILDAAASSVEEPKVMVPNESRETFKSVVERVRYSISPSRVVIAVQDRLSEEVRREKARGRRKIQNSDLPPPLARFFRLTTDGC